MVPLNITLELAQPPVLVGKRRAVSLRRPQLSKAGQSRVWKRRRRPRSRGSLSQPAKVSPLDGQASSGGESGLLPDSGMATSLVTYFHSRAIRAHQFLLDQELTSSQKNAERLIAHSRITFFNWLNSELFIQGNLCATAIPSYHFLLF